ncbi:MAG: hypothetical protein HC780_06070 [Leptolyngbyaceae cyanobacterium CSU_1_3]|nr:hypothetical protein [Leptolyngbyaceae cyanobacterium CSU_1_3]
MRQYQTLEQNYRTAKVNEIQALNTAANALMQSDQNLDARLSAAKAASLIQSAAWVNVETQDRVRLTVQKMQKVTSDAKQKESTKLLDYDRSIAGICDQLNNHLLNHPKTLEEITVCQTPILLSQASSMLIARGEELAKSGDVNAAIVQFQQAKKWNAQLALNPKTTAQKLADRGEGKRLIAEGEKLAQADNIEGAIAKFQTAQKLGTDLNIDPRLKAQQLAATALIHTGEESARKGDIQTAIAHFNRAKLLAPTLKVSARSWNTLCWFGSLHQQATDVMDACEKAVAFSPTPEFANYQNSRGIARAIAGDRPGAITDLQASLSSTDNPQRKAQQQRWISILRKGDLPTNIDIQQLLNNK